MVATAWARAVRTGGCRWERRDSVKTAYGQRLRTGLDRSCAIGWLGLALPRVYRRGEGRHAFLALTMVMVHARYTCVRYAFSSVPYTSDWCVEPGRGRGARRRTLVGSRPRGRRARISGKVRRMRVFITAHPVLRLPTSRPGPMVRGRVGRRARAARARPRPVRRRRKYQVTTSVARRRYRAGAVARGGSAVRVRRVRRRRAAASRPVLSCGGAGPLRPARWRCGSGRPVQLQAGVAPSDVFEVVPGLERKGGTSDDSALPKIEREWFRGAKGYAG